LSQPCLYCGSHHADPLHRGVEDRLGHVPGQWDWLRCRNCGSGILSPFPKREEIPSFYPPVYTFGLKQDKQTRLQSVLAAIEYQGFFRPQYEGQARKILRTTRLLNQRPAMLDIGCGRGLRLVSFQSLGARVQGMDFTPESIDYLQNDLKIPAICTDIPGLHSAFDGQRFDLITAFQLIEHVPDVHEMLDACRALLKPGGWLVVAAPMPDGIQAKIFGPCWVAATEVPRHLSLPSRKGMKLALAQHGFGELIFSHDSTLMSAGAFGLSAVPGAATTHLHRRGKITGTLYRAAGAFAALASLPVCFLENYIWKRPALGIVFARKAEE
jgi:SAM-dependent methyltransferase